MDSDGGMIRARHPRNETPSHEHLGVYVTSRGFRLPASGAELSKRVWFNLWRRRHWPYSEVLPGDILYWHESPTGLIRWKSRVQAVHRFPYRRKTDVAKTLRGLGEIDIDEKYAANAPAQGYCLAVMVRPLKPMSRPKPANLAVPRLGWLRVDERIADNWFNELLPEGASTLDKLAPEGSLMEKIVRINEAMEGISPKRVEAIVTQTIRRDSQLVRALKELRGYRCEFPECGVGIPKGSGGYYVEVAHIKPVRKGGRSVLGNLLVLCPNHHKEFDLGDRLIEEQTPTSIRGILNGKRFEITLPSDAA